MPGQYAKTTEVSPEKTLSEIRAVLNRYGADEFAMREQQDRVGVGFKMRQRMVLLEAKLPAKKDFSRTPERGIARTASQTQAAYDQAVRQVWRALFLVIKSKLESVESGIETFEEAFQAQLVLPSGQTVGEWIAPQVARAYETGSMPPLLPDGAR